MKLSRLCAVAALLSLASALQSHASTPAVGQPAPALNFTQLYGAPDGTKTDWPSLHGKVVVLEFWATWCAPCIAEIPHLNELAQSVADNNIQFIAVDDEDPAVVTEFLAKKHMAGWVGVDTTKKIFDDYGVQMRPTTIVIDTQGRIAGVLNPQSLNKDQLVSLAAGATTVFPAGNDDALGADAIEAIKEARAMAAAPDSGSGSKPLFEISIRPGDPDGREMMLMGSDTNGGSSYDFRNAPLSMLMSWSGGMPFDRVTVHGDAAKARYNLHLSAPDLDLEKLRPALEAAVTSASGMELTHVAAEEGAWILKATPQATNRLTPTASKRELMSTYNPRSGELIMVGASIDSLTSTLESALGVPVLNETGIAGEFDATFSFPKGGFDSAKAALETNLGLTLINARRPIERVVLDPLPNPPKVVVTYTPGKAAIVTGQPVQSIAVPRPQP
jgi:uncharacterized protein (TIGR03435 family)